MSEAPDTAGRAPRRPGASVVAGEMARMNLAASSRDASVLKSVRQDDCAELSALGLEPKTYGLKVQTIPCAARCSPTILPGIQAFSRPGRRAGTGNPPFLACIGHVSGWQCDPQRVGS